MTLAGRVAALRQAAAEATAGPWFDPVTMGAISSNDPGEVEAFALAHGSDTARAYGGSLVAESVGARDRRYLVAVSPDTLIALLDDVADALQNGRDRE